MGVQAEFDLLPAVRHQLSMKKQATITKVVRPNLVARLNSFLVRSSVLEDDPLDNKSAERLPMHTTELDSLMKSGASCSKNELNSGLTHVEAELEKDDIPNNRRDYLMTLHTYL